MESLYFHPSPGGSEAGSVTQHSVPYSGAVLVGLSEEAELHP